MPFYLDKRESELTNLYNCISEKIKKISLLKMAGKNFQPPKEMKLISNKRAAFRAFGRGSFTVEAAMALPLFLLSILACISLMDLYRLRMETTAALQERAEKLGMYAYELGEDAAQPYVDLTETVRYRIPFLPFGLPDVEFVCRARVHAWVGRLEADPAEGSGTAPELVYVTENGSVYHTTSRCTHLSLSIRQLPALLAENARNQQGDRYRACEKCVGDGEKNSLLFVTEQGDCYHNSLECSGLKRSVRLEEASSLEGIPLCSRCAALGEAS